MHALTKSEFMKMVINDWYFKRYKKSKEKEYVGCIAESVMRCKKESKFKNPKMIGQR